MHSPPAGLNLTTAQKKQRRLARALKRSLRSRAQNRQPFSFGCQAESQHGETLSPLMIEVGQRSSLHCEIRKEKSPILKIHFNHFNPLFVSFSADWKVSWKVNMCPECSRQCLLSSFRRRQCGRRITPLIANSRCPVGCLRGNFDLTLCGLVR